MTVQVAAGWYPDPAGRHQLRYWNGETWTEHVADSGATSRDPLMPGQGTDLGWIAIEPTRTQPVRASSIVLNATLIVLSVALLSVSFLDWLGLSAQVGAFEASTASNAWEFTACVVAVVLGGCVAIPAIVRLSGARVPAVIVAGMGAVAFAIVLIKLIVGIDVDTFDYQLEKTREIGIYLGLAITAVITAVGMLQVLDDARTDQ